MTCARTSLGSLNLETKINHDLRDVATCPQDMLKAIEILAGQLGDTMGAEKIKLLGQLGSFNRILGNLERAEDNLKKAIQLSDNAPGLQKFRITNLIRLGHVRHWQERFGEAHEIFDDCIQAILSNEQLKTLLDFAYQHRGKCYFDEQRYEEALKSFYEAILLRNNKSESDLADSSLLAIEETKRRWLPQVAEDEVQRLLDMNSMPIFVKKVMDAGANENSVRSNCINGAMNFHTRNILRADPYKPMELLTFLMEETDQLTDEDDYQFGDLVVWWNRSGGKWEKRQIRIDEIRTDDPEFPYGLIFDHVAIRVTPEIVFNKPNPSPQSKCRFDYLKTAAYPSRLGRGHEMTLHRLKL
jgi:tetratricopeptide (TPR) repeat protein